MAPQKEYLRKVLKTTILNTAVQDDPAIPVETLTKDAPYYAYQAAVCPDAARVASHQVIEEHIGTSGRTTALKKSPIRLKPCATAPRIIPRLPEAKSEPPEGAEDGKPPSCT